MCRLLKTALWLALASSWLATAMAQDAALTTANPKSNGNFLQPNGEVFPLPDLAVVEFRATAAASYDGKSYFSVPVRFTVTNQGQRPAGAFKCALYVYDRTARPAVRLVKFTTATPGQKPGWYAWSPPLEVGDRQTFVGRVSLSAGLAGKSVRLLMHVDSTAGEEPSRKNGRVGETSEKNNWADSIPVRLPLVFGNNAGAVAR